MPRDRQPSSRSLSRSPRRYNDTGTDVHRLDFQKYDDTRLPPSARSRSRSRSRERRSRSPVRKRERRHHSRSSSSSRSRSKSRGRRPQRRSRSRSGSKERKGKRRRDRDLSSPSESADGTSRRKKGKYRDKDAKRSKSKDRRKEKKREKKGKKGKVYYYFAEQKRDEGNVPHWGKYGIISDIDIFTKGTEFHTWLVEERKINPEKLSKDQEKKEFSHFVEDYNTATLPHEKYYNMEAYDRRMAALRQGEYLPPADDIYDYHADMKALSGAHKKKPTEHETYMSKEQLMDLRKVQQERNEIGRMKLLGMDVKQNFGVRMDATQFDD